MKRVWLLLTYVQLGYGIQVSPTYAPPIVEVPAPTDLEIIEKVKEITEQFSLSLQEEATTAKPLLGKKSNKVKVDFKYHSHDEFTELLKYINITFPRLTHLYSIGKSIEGRDLWAIAIGPIPRRHVLGRPEVKLIGNILGNEPITKELLLQLISFLVNSYQSNSGVRSLLNKMRLHVLPSMNPDGAEKYHNSNVTMCRGPTEGRKNAADVDLNRSFPHIFGKTPKSGPAPERDAIQKWMEEIPFVMSISFRSGAVVATYPYDSASFEDRKHAAVFSAGNIESLTPDDDMFRHLASTYATNHDSMFLGRPCNIDGRTTDLGFPNGTINGASWQVMKGSMQDYNYAKHGILEITAYISCCKYIEPHDIEKVWLDNRNALQLILAEVNRGVRGFVKNTDGMPVPNATAYIIGRETANFSTTAHGEFWRLLLPGYYTIEFKAEGYELAIIPFIVEEEKPLVLNITMKTVSGPREQLIKSKGEIFHLEKLIIIFCFTVMYFY
ncbi:carboxypeptidase D-like isoform X2 [Artemia franciscana]|uniref:carboxypeptidase D-like isoform X2 n=1 Tax=Artemia franciscana TaxID=6661 RepID=UPI0032DA0BF7